MSVLRVRCYDNWGDLDDALRFLTPKGNGMIGGVQFVRSDDPAPDWIGVFNAPAETVRLRASPNRVFFAIGEPPSVPHRPFHLGQGEGAIVFTCDGELCRAPPPERRYVLTPAMTRTWSVRHGIEALRSFDGGEKPKMLSWVTSGTALMEGHRYRLRFLEKLRSQAQFDLFGRGFNPIADKWPAIAPYRYSIAFENTRAPYYFTEKLMDCFVAETMPIYYGSPAIADFFPAESIAILDPEDPDVFAKTAEIVRSDLWHKRRDAIREAKRRVLEEFNLFARLAHFVRAEAEAAAPPRDVTIQPVVATF